MSENKFTTNNNHTLVAVSNSDGETPVYLYADPSTHGLLVSATISAVGLATSAKQDALLAELQLKADLTETQPVSLATVPSHAVTNAGTFAVQADNTKIGGNTISTDVGATGTGTQRIVLANGAGRTLLSTGGSASTSGNNTLVAAGTNRLKVYAFTLSTTSTTAMTCIFQSGATGTELWRVVLQAPTSISTGANLVVQPPAWLFATASATLLNLNLSSANAVHWSVSYFDEA